MATTQSDNSNAPGTFPTPDPVASNAERLAKATSILDQSSASMNDKNAPFAADPLNGGVPTATASDAPDANTVLELELGGTGTILVHGILAEADYNADLAGRERINVYDQMRKGDATCRLGLAAVKYPILAAKWYIKPGDGEDDDGEKTSFIKQELFANPNFSWTNLLRQLLLFCDYGNSFAEKVWRMRADGKIGWKKFASRLPKTVWRYTLQDGETPGITQILPTGGVVEIPQWKLVMCVLDLEGSNYEGTSLLRPAYQPWWYKTTYYKIDSIATERQGMGVPVIKVPPQATPQDKARAKVIAKNMRVNEQAYIDLPAGFTIEYIDTKAKELKEVKEMVFHHDRQILKAFLAQFLDLGAHSAGSQALTDNQNDLFLLSLKYIASIVQEQLNLAIRELVDLNFTGTKPEEYPTLEFGNIGNIDFEKFSTALMRLAQGGILVPDDDLERHVRNAMDLPEAMQTSDTEHTDLATRKVTTPPDLDDPNAVQIRKPIRYALDPNAGGRSTTPAPTAKATQAKQFIEDILTLKEELEDHLFTENGY